MRNPHSYGYQSGNDYRIHQISEIKERERDSPYHYFITMYVPGSNETYRTTHFGYNKTIHL